MGTSFLLMEVHSLNVYLLLILLLQREHNGMRFSGVVGPPLDSGILWPDWKSKTVIVF